MKGTPSTLSDLESTHRGGIDNGRIIDRCDLEDCLITSPETRWTNEKHDAYLESMERSFVQQLQGSRSRIHKGCSGYTSIIDAGSVCRHPSHHRAIHSKEGEMKPESIESRRRDRADEARHSGSDIPSSLQHSSTPSCHTSSPSDDGYDVSEHSGQNF